MDERRRRRNREGRVEMMRLNRWRRRLVESMPSPESAQLGRDARPRPWPRGEENRRLERRGGGRIPVDAGRPDARQSKARHLRVAGWRPDEGREKVALHYHKSVTVPSNTQQVKPAYRKPYNNNVWQLFGSSFTLNLTPSSKYPASKTCIGSPTREKANASSSSASSDSFAL